MKRAQLFSLLQRLGQSLMLPVSALPAAGLIVALGRLLESSGSPGIQGLGKLFYSGGLAIFEQLPAVFAIGVAIGFTGGAGAAGLAAVVGYFTLINFLKVIGEIHHLSVPIDTGVFGGIAVGLLSAAIYRRFHQTQLPAVLGFFSGKRLVPILTVVSVAGLGLVLGYLWPPIQDGIKEFGTMAMDSAWGPAFYAAGKRFLIPVGLHHVYYPPFLYQFGEYAAKTGEILHGDSARYFGGDPTAGAFMAAEFPIMLFGLPAAALAMTLRALPERRKMVAGIMLSAALTSIITGITEPLEFAFIFVAPPLYLLHVGMAFVSGFLTKLFDIHLGYTFSASLIDFGIGYFNQKNSLYFWTLVGPAVGLIYFTCFYTMIGWFDFKTPGREQEDGDGESMPVSTGSVSEKASLILAALGGSRNIENLDACITRLRVTIQEMSAVRTAELKALGAAGVMKADAHNLQVVFGTQSDQLKEEIRRVMEAAPTSRVVSPLSGRLVPLSEVPDPTFAEKVMGDGIAIEPDSGLVVAPFDGKVTHFFRTSHAVGLVSETGIEILIHVGIDTVKLNGEGFKALAQTDQVVKAGQPLLEFDLERVRGKAKSLITPVVITNLDQLKGMKIVRSKGKIDRLTPLLEVQV